MKLPINLQLSSMSRSQDLIYCKFSNKLSIYQLIAKSFKFNLDNIYGRHTFHNLESMVKLDRLYVFLWIDLLCSIQATYYNIEFG